MDHSAVLQIYRLPASLRPVHSFPVLRLLRKLHPGNRPSPTVAASPVRTGQACQVPVFRSSTFVPLGGRLYPRRCRRRAERAVPVSDTVPVPSREDRRTSPLQIAYLASHAIARPGGIIGIPRLQSPTSLSRHRYCGSPAYRRWSASGTFKADLLMTLYRRRPIELLGPLPPVAPTGGAALQPPVENQQA